MNYQNNPGVLDWRKRHPALIKTMALFLFLTFLLYDITWAQGGTPLWQNAKPVGVGATHEKNNINGIAIPADVGKIDSVYSNGKDQTIINIQDAHASLSAQKSIVKILDHLVANYNLNFIAVEGSEGYVDTSILRTCPSKEIKKKTADYLMEQGRMSAGEFFTIMSEKPIAFYGIEDNNLYKENVELFKSVMEDKAVCNKQIEALEAALKELEDKVYNKELGEFVRQSRSHKEGTLSFSQYWEYITILAENRNIEVKGYGNITRLLSAIKLEKEINFEKANEERKALIDQLSKKVDKETLEKIVLESVAFKKGEINNVEFHNYLIDLAEKTDIDPTPHKNLINFTKYIAVYETVDIFSLYSELDALESSVIEKLYTSQDERSLYDLQKKARMLKGLFNTNLTNDDAEYLIQHKNEFKADEIADFIRKNYLKYTLVMGSDYDLGYIAGKLDEAIKFYKIAHQRNDAMLRNTIANMKHEGQNVAALITGGFHTRGLADLVKDKKLSYLVIMPKFKQGEDRPYIAILTNKREPYEELLKTGQYQLGVYQYFSRGDISDLAVSVAIPLIERSEELKAETSDTITEELEKLAEAWKGSYRDAYKISEYRKSKLSAERLSPEIFNTMINWLVEQVSGGGFDNVPYSELTNNPGFKRIISAIEARQNAPKGEASKPIADQSSNLPPSPKKAPEETDKKMQLHKELTLANHIFMSIHAAFLFPYYIDRILQTLGIHTVLNLTPESFVVEIITGLVFAIITAWIAIGWHERGHYMQSIRQITLNEKLLPAAQARMKGSFVQKLLWNAEVLLKTAAGRFPGIKRAGLSYYVDAPFNLSVAAAGPRASRNMSIISFPIAALFITVGFLTGMPLLLYVGRVFLGLSVVGLIDFKFADTGSYRKFQEQESKTVKHAQKETAKGAWLDTAPLIKNRMQTTRIQEMTLPDGTLVRAPWGFRNSGMGGKHTEKEYPESNLSMQEAMFIPLTAKNYEEAQRMTVDLQTRLMQIINKTPGCRVMGIGLEGGLATYITKDDTDKVPEQKLWRLMKRAIEDLEYNKEGKIDVAIAFDPAASELENNYREEYTQPDAVGMYLFWRSKEKVVMSREDLLELYKTALNEGIPIVSIEDGFAEDDDAGWALLMEELGDKIFIIGDDLITTNDATIEKKMEWIAPDGAKKKLINVSLIKANQIGTLTETILAMLTSLGKSAELVVSHRSKSPNDDMEAQIALAAMAVGLKAGGGANTERLVKYGSIIKLFKDLEDEVRRNIAEENGTEPADVSERDVEKVFSNLRIASITAYEESTNAGVPTVGVKVTAGVKGSERFEKMLSFTGSTPLGTSAGTGEANHLVDSIIEKCELTQKYPDLFKEGADLTYTFKKDVTEKAVAAKNDPALSALWQKANRYGGKGCLNAVSNVEDILSKLFVGKKVSELKSVGNIDNILLNAELDLAIQRGKIAADASQEDKIKIMQYKGNLGMNAILSLSLALSRLFGALNGKDMWQVIREQMTETMAKTILTNGGLNNITNESLKLKVKQAIEKNRGLEEWQVLVDTVSFEDLVKGLEQVNATKPEGTPLYELLRAQLPVYDVKTTAKTFGPSSGDYHNWFGQNFESGKFNADASTGKHFSFTDATLDAMFNESFDLLEGLVKEDPKLEKHLSEILSQDHNKSPPIGFDGKLSENSHRLGEAIKFDTRFISDLVRQYNAGYKDWARYVLAHRLLHELGHTPTANLSEEEELIGYDLLLYNILKAKGVQQKIAEIFEKYKGEISFPSGYYFNLLEAISNLPSAEQQARAIKIYAEHPDLSKEDIANLTDAIRYGYYEGSVDLKSALLDKKVIYYPGAWFDVAGITDVIDASPAANTVILLDRKYNFYDDERLRGMVKTFETSLQRSGFEVVGYTLEEAGKNVITFKTKYNKRDIEVKVIGGNIETGYPKKVGEEPAVHIVKYMDLFRTAGNTSSEFYAKMIGTMKEGDVLLITETKIPTIELSPRLVGLAPLIDVKGAFGGYNKWADAYKKVKSHDENTIKQVLEIDHFLTEIDRSSGKEDQRRSITQASYEIDELLKGIPSGDVKTQILNEIRQLPVHKTIKLIIERYTAGRRFGPFVDKNTVIFGIPETIVKSEAERSEIVETLTKINRSGDIYENVEPVFFQDTGNDIENMKQVESIAKERGAVLGIPVRSDISVEDLLKEINGGFLARVSRDLFSLTNPDIDKLDETRARFENRDKLSSALKELTRLFPAIVSEKLSELSIYNMRMTAIAQKTASGQLPPYILTKVTDSKEKRALSMRADTLGELKLLAEAHRARMNLARNFDKTAVPVKLQIRLMLRQDEKEKVQNITNAEILKRMGIENVLLPEDVIRVDSESAGSVNVAVKDAYDRLLSAGYGIDKIAIVDRVKENRDDVPEGATFVEYDDEIVTSYHYDAALELMATPDDTTLSIRDAGKKNWFRIKPITKIDFDQLREEIKGYEKVLIAA